MIYILHPSRQQARLRMQKTSAIVVDKFLSNCFALFIKFVHSRSSVRRDQNTNKSRLCLVLHSHEANAPYRAHVFFFKFHRKSWAMRVLIFKTDYLKIISLSHRITLQPGSIIGLFYKFPQAYRYLILKN